MLDTAAGALSTAAAMVLTGSSPLPGRARSGPPRLGQHAEHLHGELDELAVDEVGVSLLSMLRICIQAQMMGIGFSSRQYRARIDY